VSSDAAAASIGSIAPSSGQVAEDAGPLAASSPDDAGSGPTGPFDAGIPGARVGPGTTLAGCAIFPPENPWNLAIDGPGVHVIHDYDSELPQDTSLHADFGAYSDGVGIPYVVVDGGRPDQPIAFTVYAAESDPGPGGWIGRNPNDAGGSTGHTAWPFFVGMPVEGNPAPGGVPGSLSGDQHAIVLQQGMGGCVSYEAWSCVQVTEPPFACGNGAVFDLTSNALRPAGWTSADVAGLSVLAGLVKLSEVRVGAITHAIRVTLLHTQSGYVSPARHAVEPGGGAAPIGSAYPPMGLRLRLKGSVSLAGLSTPAQTVALAMKTYGLIVADVGKDFFFQGDSDDGWNDAAPDGVGTLIDELSSGIATLKGSDFEAIDSGKPSTLGL
jgi:hypothetical protein